MVLSVAAGRSLCGCREISLWPKKDPSVATERSFCGHRHFSAATKRPLCGHREISLQPQRDFSAATERSPVLIRFGSGSGSSSGPLKSRSAIGRPDLFPSRAGSIGGWPDPPADGFPPFFSSTRTLYLLRSFHGKLRHFVPCHLHTDLILMISGDHRCI